ncbi:MAG: RsmE family RNA methyltransferase [Candidatus Babeliaceae bacterium]|nr:RsmE family RNA methyltransferase [Candidatus Babeliaceae bacterium]
MKKSSEVHEFAFFIDSKTIIIHQHAGTLVLKDASVMNRIVNVVRLTAGEHVILFNQKTAYACTINEITKKHITCAIRSERAIELGPPIIDLLVPLLEREALEEVIYMATVYQIRSIYFIATEKSRKNLSEKDLARFHKIAISAAEQSKQFCIPCFNHVPNKERVLSIESFIAKHADAYKDSLKLWCDTQGTPILEYLSQKAKSYSNYLITFGPEGDFTHAEKELLSTSFMPIKLSRSVLRAKDAASLIMGIVR